MFIFFSGRQFSIHSPQILHDLHEGVHNPRLLCSHSPRDISVFRRDRDVDEVDLFGLQVFALKRPTQSSAIPLSNSNRPAAMVYYKKAAVHTEVPDFLELVDLVRVKRQNSKVACVDALWCQFRQVAV